MSIERLAAGGPHRRYLYGYLSQLKEDNPDWLIAKLGADGEEEYLYLKTGVPHGKVVIIPLEKGRELRCIQALRRWVVAVE